jgi:dolichyl-phosphate-mannose-protein mannosyltransferase
VDSPRIMFFYHYTPAVPLLSILLCYWLYQMLLSKETLTRALGQLAIMVCIAVFIVWYPQWTAIPVPKEFADKVYYAITSWK